MATLDTVKAIAPTQTAGMTDDEITVFIELAMARMGVCVWGALYTQGLAYLTAHLIVQTLRMAAGGGAGAGGPVSQEMAGRVMVAYATTASAGGADLAATPYGQEFLGLRRKLAGVRMFNTGFVSGDMCNNSSND